jgi:2-polyprenyl-3-methyl-5-hydroxy-6-metoxy-1,4-benzoquinol methylase
METIAFLDHLKAAYRGAALTQMIELGSRHGLFDSLAVGPATSEALAARTGLDERQLREWLGAVTVGEITTFDPNTKQYTLPAEHALWVTGTRHTNITPIAGMLNGLSQRIGEVADAFGHGQGVPYESYRPHFTCSMDVIGRAKYDALLVKVYLPKVAGLVDALRSGVRVADVGCGTGHCVNLMAQAFPESSFVGFDFSVDAIALARAEAEQMGLTNATFEVADAATVAQADERFDVVFAFDAIHDQADPAGVLAAIHRSLKPGGRFVMLDINASSDLADNLAEPGNLILYAMSVMHCMQVSLAGGGPGLGTVWGHQLATSMLADAGFTDIDRSDLEGDPTNCLYASIA